MAQDRTRRRKAGLHRVGDALKEVIQELGLEARKGDAQVMASWGLLVGPAIAKATAPLSLRNGVLELGVAGAAWAAEIKLLAPQLLAKLEAHLGPGRVQALRTKVVGKAALTQMAAPQSSHLPPKPVGPSWMHGSAVGAASPEVRSQWVQASFQIPDPKLAAAVARAGAALADLQAARNGSGALPCTSCGAACSPGVGQGPGLCPPCQWQVESNLVRTNTEGFDGAP